MSSPTAVVCREIFDENSQPSAEEISEYATQLGIDPDSESHLLPLARDGLMQALPAPWKAYYDDKIQSHYYFNEDTKRTQWEHPLDHIYRELVKKARDASVHDDTCASVQELPTSEDYTKILERVETKVESDEEFSTDSENHASDVRDNQTLTGSRRLTPLGRPPPSPLTREKKLGDTRISPLRRSVDSSISSKPGLMRNTSDRDLLNRPSFERPKLLFKQQSEIIDLKMHVLTSPEEEHYSSLLMGTKIDRGLSLTGKGSMFLKASKSDLPSPDTDKSLPLDSVTKSDPPKGILREKLTDAVHKKVDTIFAGRQKQPASFEEDRKSVRFKLENLPEPTLSPGSNSSSEQNDGQSSIISAAPPSIPSSPHVMSSNITSSPIVPLNQIVLTPLVTRPPLPPRPGDSPREVKSLSGSERDSVEDLPSPGGPCFAKLQTPTPTPPSTLFTFKQKSLPLPKIDNRNKETKKRQPSSDSEHSESFSKDDELPPEVPSAINLTTPAPLHSRLSPLEQNPVPLHTIDSQNNEKIKTSNDSQSSSDDDELPQEIPSPIQLTAPAPLPSRLSPLEQIPMLDSQDDKVKTSMDSEHSSVENLTSSGVPSPIKLPEATPMYPRTLSPLKLKPDPLPIFRSEKQSSTNSESNFDESDSHNRGTSPRRRVLRPPAGDYIKPDLFQKNFQKISDLVRPGDIDTKPVSLEEPVFSEKEARPRSPMIPQKSKISINLMESIESETSIDSPDREFANIDLNDFDDSNDKEKHSEALEKTHSKDEENSEKKSVSDRPRSENILIPQIKVPTLDFSKHSDSEESKKTSILEESRSKSHELSLKSHDMSLKSPQIKISPTPSLGSDIRSPRLDFSKPWSPLSTFKPLNKAIIAPQIKTSDSASSLSKGLSSPRLDGVILSQGKSSSDNVVVVYQFETQEDNFPKQIKSPMMPDMGTRDMIERNKTDERRRLELALQKELESIRMESSGRERKLRAELQEDLKGAEEKFLAEKKMRLSEQAERQRREMEEALHTTEQNHKQLLERATSDLAERYKRDIESAEKQHLDNMSRLQQQCREKLYEQQRHLEIENERALSELRDQLHANLSKERSRMIEENRATVETLREEHTARVTELRHDYRAEVERLRTQHACHLEELRSRLASERAAGGRLHEERALQDKYKCLKEKYVRLKHDVKMSIERRNKRREMSMTTGSETEKSNSHKANQSLERCKELNETSVSVVVEPVPPRVNNNPSVKYNDNETSYSESNAHKPTDNNNELWKLRRDNTLPSADTSAASGVKPSRAHRRTAVAFREPPRRRRDKDRDTGATTDCQDSSDATTADEKPKENINGHGRRRCFTRLKSASTSRLNYSPKRGEGWSSPLESLRQQLRKLDDLEDQFPDLALQPAYSLRYPFGEIGAVATADTPELEFVRHRALVEREGMRRARAALKRRKAALVETRASLSPHRAPSEEREATELEVALHRARALLGEKEIRLRHIERALRRLADAPPPIQEATTSEASSGSEAAPAEAGGAVLRSLRALHADVRDIWRALDARRPHTASPETSSCNAPTTSQTRMTLSAPEPIIQDNSDGGVAERARVLRAWLQTAP